MTLEVKLADTKDVIKRKDLKNNSLTRIFPRSPAAIGRNVENCHPPGSVHVVNNIIDEFKKGHKDSASFWIKFKGKKKRLLEWK